MKRYPKIILNNYRVGYSEETQEYKAIANVSIEGSLSQIIEFEDYVKHMFNRMLRYNSEVDLVKEYIEKNKNETCENCIYYSEDDESCDVLEEKRYTNKYYTCGRYIERGDSKC